MIKIMSLWSALGRCWDKLASPRKGGPPGAGRRPRMLIVDDDDEFLSILAQRFRARGFEPVTADDGDRALEIVRSGSVDLVLLDMRMPKVDGLLTLREMLDVDSGLPVIAMSGETGAEHARLILDEGAREFLPKPLEFERLDEVIEANLAGRKK